MHRGGPFHSRRQVALTAGSRVKGVQPLDWAATRRGVARHSDRHASSSQLVSRPSRPRLIAKEGEGEERRAEEQGDDRDEGHRKRDDWTSVSCDEQLKLACRGCGGPLLQGCWRAWLLMASCSDALTEGVTHSSGQLVLRDECCAVLQQAPCVEFPRPLLLASHPRALPSELLQ